VAWPVFVVGDNPTALAVTVAIDDAGALPDDPLPANVALNDVERARRRYISSLVRVRLHQRIFRERVLEAYQRQCAFCRLRHEELLDAAHIIPDAHPQGEPLVQNGLALCALHHSAFDAFFIGLRPDYVLEVREDILRETDGPTLAHAIQGMHGKTIVLPRSVKQRPDPDRLELRYEKFRRAV
jgi:putative restriction endonuclease